MENKYYKLKLCNFYEKYGKCNKKDCSYAHGKDELKSFKKECINGLFCFKENCNFTHPEDWKPENNKKICEYYMNDGLCRNGDNCNFRHNNKDIEVSSNVDINSYNEFSSLEEDISEQSTNNEDNKKIDLNNNVKIIVDNEENKSNIVLSVDEDIKSNEEEYDIVKDLTSNNFPYINEDNNIKIFVNGVEYNDKDNILNINDNIKIKENSNIINNLSEDENINIIEVEDIINNLQNDFLEFSRKIKNNIDKTFMEDKNIYGINMKLELNKIISEIDLFKNNYQDIVSKEIKK